MSKKKSSPFIIVDGSSYLFRAYYALPPLTASSGQPTGAIYGVMNMLRKLLKEYEPEHIVVIFDSKKKNFRHKLYPQYKANRPPMPEDLRVQIKPLHDIIDAMGLPRLVIDGVEADDVIATLAQQAQQLQMPVLISTGDKDIAQLVNDQVTLINTMTGSLLDEAGVKKKFGVLPGKITDYLALIGDKVDNVPGVPKVGPKTAEKWLTSYGSLEEIIAHAEDFPGKIGENLRSVVKDLPLSKQLVTLKFDVELSVTPQKLNLREPDKDKLNNYFAALGFRSWYAQEQEKTPSKSKKGSAKYEIILDKKLFGQWLKKLQAVPCFALDTETTSLDAMAAELVGISFAIKGGQAAYVPLQHDYVGAPEQLEKKWVLAQLKPLLQDSKRVIVGQNLKYDYKVLANCGIELKASLYDTMLAAYVLHGTLYRRNLDALAKQHLNYDTIKFEDIAGKGVKQLTFNQVHLDIAAPYAAEDADIALKLQDVLDKQINAVPKLKSVLVDIELPLLNILAKMEYYGVKLDVDLLNKQSASLARRIKILTVKIYKLADEEFNIASPKQLQNILFNKLEIPVAKKTPTGQPSTSESVLEVLALDHEIAKLILEYRSLSKLKSTYTDRLPEQVDARTDRVHTSYNQAVTSTGRLSSQNPNLQNIPVRTEAGRKIRQAFIAPRGSQIVSADYSQVELRIMAHLSKDKRLVKSFNEGLDIHRATAAEVFGVAVDRVSPEQRYKAKAINFGLIYGMSAHGLSRQLGISRQSAQDYIETYFARYPGVRAYIDRERETAGKQGFVETFFGRRLYVPDIKSKNAMQRRAAERAAINAPLQGTAADIIKLAMIAIDRKLCKNHANIIMLMQVHDELVFQVSRQDLKKAKNIIKDCMENAVKLIVPLSVAIGVGNNWDEAH